MECNIYSNAQAFLSDAQRFLEADEAVNNVFLSNCLRLAADPEQDNGSFYAAVLVGGNPLLAAMMHPYHLVLAGEEISAVTAIPSLVGALRTGGWILPGVLGPGKLACAFAEQWAAAAAVPYHLRVCEGVYAARKVIFPQDVPGTLQQATTEHENLVLKWMLEFYAELGLPVEREGYLNRVRSYFAGGDYFLWHDANPVCIAGQFGRTQNGIRIGSVYTPPELRCNGYASACVAELARQALDGGRYFVTLNTDLANPTSNHIYQEIGFRRVGEFDLYMFDSPEP